MVVGFSVSSFLQMAHPSVWPVRWLVSHLQHYLPLKLPMAISPRSLYFLFSFDCSIITALNIPSDPSLSVTHLLTWLCLVLCPFSPIGISPLPSEDPVPDFRMISPLVLTFTLACSNVRWRGLLTLFLPVTFRTFLHQTFPLSFICMAFALQKCQSSV